MTWLLAHENICAMNDGTMIHGSQLHYNTNDTAILTANSEVVTSATIRNVNKCQPGAAQTVTLPSISQLIARGWQSGARFKFLKGNELFNTTIVPDAADNFFGGVNFAILAAGVPDAIEFQMPSVSNKWIILDQKHYGRSEFSVDPAGGTTTLTAATIAETIVVTPTVGAGAVVLPTIASLIAAGYPPGFDFTICTNGAQIVTVAPNAADTFLAQVSPRSFAATTVAHSMTVRLPAAGPGAWRIPAATST